MTKLAYTPSEAAAETATSETIIMAEIRAGRLRTRLAGKATRVILHADLEEWALELTSIDQGLDAPSRVGLPKLRSVVSLP